MLAHCGRSERWIALIAAPKVKVLDKALAIIDELSHVGECSRSDLSRSMDLPVSTVHRIPATLELHDYMRRDLPSGRYGVGPKIASPRANTDGFRELADAAAPAMAQLGRMTSETVLLSRLDRMRDRSICVARVESPLPLRLELLPATQTPLYLGAHQVALLAFMDAFEINELLGKPLRRSTPRTVTDPVRLRRRLARIRNTGYAWISEETTPDVAGLAVPLFDRMGRIAFSFGIAGPSNRLTAEAVQQYLAAIRTAAAGIAERLELSVWEGGQKARAVAK